MSDKATGHKVEDADFYRPIGSDWPVEALRRTPITDAQRQTHALEYIAKTMGAINSKLDRIIAASEKKRDEP